MYKENPNLETKIQCNSCYAIFPPEELVWTDNSEFDECPRCGNLDEDFSHLCSFKGCECAFDLKACVADGVFYYRCPQHGEDVWP